MEVGWSAAGVDFAGDVLGSLGGVCVVAWDWPAEAKSPQVVFGAELRDAARFINATERIAASHQTAPVRWRMSDGWLWLSSSAAALENVSRAAAGAAPSLGGDPQWPKRLEGLPHNNWLWMYADTARLARGGQQESANHLAPLLACATALGDNNAVTVTSSLGTVATAWLALERLAGPVAGK
ncbi:MAG: hypothetical protein HZA91_19160 [Verrucomicrobia bacterium]|nr:hypothetical protein [Verrucomicrobiota bacterium]